VVLLGCLAAIGSPACSKRSQRVPAGAPLTRVSVERYRADLEFIARPRPPGSAHWQAVQDRCANELGAAGLAVRRDEYESGVNVVGELEGATRPDQIVLIGAHYDSTEGCPGADDNASGVAGALEAARVLAGQRYARTLVIACWDEEERGFLGSTAHASALDDQGRRPAVVYDLEMIGYRSDAPGSQSVAPGFEVLFPDAARRVQDNDMRGDFIALVHDPGAREAAAGIARHAAGLSLPVIPLEVPEAAKRSPLLRDLRRSDHAPFWDRGVPAILATDTANFRNPRYHCGGGADEASALDPAFAARMVAALAGSAREQLDPLSPE
jgi:Zn-dependent M28 family amino/carboxypeptidase